MSYEEKFNAAVNVIRNLPKNGAYQPSHDLMLRFYAYYKQATKGPNTMTKPNFWEVIKRAKWDAWSKLGNMTREQAMINYVDELKKIVETMAYTDNVASFITSLDSFYESVPAEDLQLLIGPVIEKVRSQPGSPLSGSPLASRESSPQRINPKPPPKHITSSLETSPASSYSASPLPPDTDEEEDFLDTYEQTDTDHNEIKDCNGIGKANIKNHDNLYKTMNGTYTILSADRGRHRDKNYAAFNGHVKSNNIDRGTKIVQTEATGKPKEVEIDISEAIYQTITSLRNDLNSIKTKMGTVEQCYVEIAEQLKQNQSPPWWPLKGVPIPASVFFIIWPFIIHIFLVWYRRQRNSAV